MKKRFITAVLGGMLIAALLFQTGCDRLSGEEEAVTEDFMATVAGITVTGTVTNVCRFGTGRFSDPDCRFRIQQ